jgi:NADH dehydrogenase
VGQSSERVAAGTVFWAAGVQASPLAGIIAKTTGASLDRAGRLGVQPDLTVPGHPEIFAIGDMTHLLENGKPLPGVAQVAIQQGRYVGRTIQARLHNSDVPKPFHYVDLGNMAVIGRAAAVVQVRGLKLSGLIAWLAWAFVHLLKLIGIENRFKVFVTWAWHYVTWNSDGRLITGVVPAPPAGEVHREETPRGA